MLKLSKKKKKKLSMGVILLFILGNLHKSVSVFRLKFKRDLDLLSTSYWCLGEIPAWLSKITDLLINYVRAIKTP